MLISKKNRREVYKYLFKGKLDSPSHLFLCQLPFESIGVHMQEEMLVRLSMAMAVAEGVLQAEKDFNLASHPEIEGIPNLQV